MSLISFWLKALRTVEQSNSEMLGLTLKLQFFCFLEIAFLKVASNLMSSSHFFSGWSLTDNYLSEVFEFKMVTAKLNVSKVVHLFREHFWFHQLRWVVMASPKSVAGFYWNFFKTNILSSATNTTGFIVLVIPIWYNQAGNTKSTLFIDNHQL